MPDQWMQLSFFSSCQPWTLSQCDLFRLDQRHDASINFAFVRGACLRGQLVPTSSRQAVLDDSPSPVAHLIPSQHRSNDQPGPFGHDTQGTRDVAVSLGYVFL